MCNQIADVFKYGQPGIIVDLKHILHFEDIADLECRRMIPKSTGLLVVVVLFSLWQVTVHVDKHSASTAYRSDEDNYTHTHSRLLILSHSSRPLIYLLLSLVLSKPAFLLPLIVFCCRLNLYPIPPHHSTSCQALTSLGLQYQLQVSYFLDVSIVRLDLC